MTAITKITPASIDETGNYTVNTLTATSNVTASNANLGNLVTGNFFTGNGSLLSSITAGNITGQVANALIAGTVYTNAQPNITSVGTLSSLSVTANVSAGNILTDNLLYANGTAWSLGGGSYSNTNVAAYLPTYTGNVSANYFIGNGSTLTNLTGGNVTGQVANALVAGTVYTNAQPNITSVGTLTSLTVTGLITATGTGVKTANIQDSTGTLTIETKYGNIAGDAGIYGNLTIGTSGTGNITAYNANLGNLVIGNFIQGTLTTSAQPNITSTGTLTNLTVSGNASFTGANVYVSNVANLKIPGGTANYVLATDGASNLSWVAQTGGGGGGTPGGSNTQLQYNNSGSFGGTSGLTFDNASNRLSLTNYALVTNVLGNVTGNTTINVNLGGYVTATVTGSVTWTFSNAAPSSNASGFVLELTNGGSAAQIWPNSVKWPSGVAPTLTGTGVDVLAFVTDDNGTNWRGVASMIDSK
jgi:hypothetical protein